MRDTTPLGRPGWKLFPPEWESHHYPVANQQATALVLLWVGPPRRVFDPITETETGWDLGQQLTPNPVPARLQQISKPEPIETAGQVVTYHDYQVSLHVEVNNLTTLGVVEPVECSDPSFIGRYLRITDILRGSLRWQRDITATDNLG